MEAGKERWENNNGGVTLSQIQDGLMDHDLTSKARQNPPALYYAFSEIFHSPLHYEVVSHFTFPCPIYE